MSSKGEEPLTPLTPEQIENWRNILVIEIGPYAMIMPVEEIEACRKRIQTSLNHAQ